MPDRSSILKLLFTTVLFSVIAAESCFAQKPAGTIKGKVTSADSRMALTGITVLIKDTKSGAVTDEEGNYAILNVPAGNYVLEFRSVGYISRFLSDIQVKPGRISFADCGLQETAVEAGGVVINGGYFQNSSVTGRGVVNFNSEEIRRSPGSMGDASRILMALPSVSKVSDSNNDLIVRGGSPSENGFFVDGIPVPNINHFPSIGSTGGPIGILNVDFIDGFDFHTSGFPAEYGNRLSSIIDIRFREGNREKVDIQADLNWAGFGAGAEGPVPGGNGSWLFSFKRSYLDLISKASGWGMIIRYGDAQAKASYDLGRNHKISLLDIYAYDHEEFGRDDAIDQGSLHYGIIDNFQNTAGISWRALWSKEFYSLTSVSFAVQNFKNDFNKVSNSEKYYVADNTETSLSLRNINCFSINSSSRLEFGFDASADNAKYNYIKYADISRLGTPLPGFSLKRNTDPVRSGLFFAFFYSPAEQIQISAGVRGDHYQPGSENVISPRASLSWAATNLLTVSLNGGIFYQQNPLVIISQRPEFAGLPTLKARHIGAGIEYLLAEDTKASLEIYDKQYSRLPVSPDDPALSVIDEGISGSSFGNFTLLENRGKAFTRGVELLIQKKMSNDFYGMISGSYFRSRYEDLNGVWHDRQWDNKYMFSFTGGYKPSKDWEFSLRWTYAGGCPYTPLDQKLSAAYGTGIIDNSRINSERYPVYHSLNLRADKKFFFSSQSLDVYLSVWNAYNRKNISGYYWNPEKNSAVEMYQWTIMPIFGIEYEM